LWRLLNGEMPEDLNPKVWWINIGIFDLARHECSAQVVLLGILRIVEEIRNKKPDAFIVIGGILPASTFNKKKRFQRLKNRDRGVFKSFSSQNVWPFIAIINQALQQYSKKQELVKFFDPADIFTLKSKKGLYINNKLMMDPMLPSVRGRKVLALKMGGKISMLIKSKEAVNYVSNSPSSDEENP